MKSPGFTFYVRDWLCSNRVFNMSGDAVKAYVYLLCASWLEIPRATLPVDDEKLAQLARLKLDEWMHVKNDVLQHYQMGKCNEHLGRFYQETLLEISRKSENMQRFNNKNAKRTQIKHRMNATHEDENEKENDKNIPIKRLIKHSFEDSIYYDKKTFKEALPNWPNERLGKYYDKALGYSQANGGRYLNWIRAVKNWYREDCERHPENKHDILKGTVI